MARSNEFPQYYKCVANFGLHCCSFLLDCFFKMAEGPGNAPGSLLETLFSRQVQPAYICLPSDKPPATLLAGVCCEIGGSEGVRTLSLPADNGLLC